MLAVIINTISVVIGIFIGYFLKELSWTKKQKKETIKILKIIHTEINDNVVNKLGDKFPYKILNTTGEELLRLKTGSLIIPSEQLTMIIKIYGYFYTINDAIVNIREMKKYQKNIAKSIGEIEKWQDVKNLADEIKKWQGITRKEIYDYQEKWCKTSNNK